MSRSPLLPIFLTVFVDVMGLTLMLPLLPFYGVSFGASPFTVGLLGASYYVCQGLAGPVIGRLSDRFGRKPVLLASQTGTFLAFLIIGGASSLWMLFVGRIIDGLTAGNLSTAQAYISDVTKPENRTRAYGVIGISFGMGFLFVPAASGLLAAKYGYAVPAYVAAGLSLLSIILNVVFLPDAIEVKRIRAELGLDTGAAGTAGPVAPGGERTFAVGKFFARTVTRRRLLQYFFFTLSFAVLMGGLALFLNARYGFGIREVGYTLMVSGVMGVIIQGGLIGRMVKRLGEVKLGLFGFITMAVGYPLLGFTNSVPELVGVVCFSAFGVGVVRPCLTTLLTKSVPQAEQGEALGTAQQLASVAQILGQLIAGALIDRHLLWGYGAAAGAFAAVGGLLTALPLQEPSIDESAASA